MPSYNNPDGSGFSESAGAPVRVVTNPSSGSTITMGWNDRDLYVNISATLAALTVLLPKKVETGQLVRIGAGATVTALTLHDGFGNAVPGAPTTIAAGAAIEMRYVGRAGGDAADVGWVHWK